MTAKGAVRLQVGLFKSVEPQEEAEKIMKGDRKLFERGVWFLVCFFSFRRRVVVQVVAWWRPKDKVLPVCLLQKACDI